MGSNNTTNSQGHRKRLRERFVKTGLVGFADYEVVELLLTLAIPRGDVKPLAKSLIAGSEICAELSMRRWK